MTPEMYQWSKPTLD